MTPFQPCPYKSLDETAYWKKSVSALPFEDVNPVKGPKFIISKEDKVATAGSCFAQHIARYIKNKKYNYFVTEPGHFILDSELRTKFGYGVFSARYANIYTVRQLLQLILRATGRFEPVERVWIERGRYFDPYRPHVQPDGFASEEELLLDTKQHLKMVLKLFTEMDVFVFTLGLTEAWLSNIDGAVFPLCPGCGVGQFDPDKYTFVNFDVVSIIADLNQAVDLLKSINPALKIILTVSPVPLIATYSGKHVLQATTYSKSVLRVAAETVANTHEDVDYFPSYELITGSFNRGRYFADDLREVKEEGVHHVMKVFFKEYMGINADVISSETPQKSTELNINQIVAKVVCDEENLVK